ncbi:uncharacterized protein LOC129585248 isoform X2 [Paramacrobiotus metropolitanus]|nr:uncharacterized protein LOC129585248 isoform X2 [Paramacrobiotus metropolitanus]XP_055333858.1 uncharacterized protein LOC129585248 isoform X2 [Paramacrobiotus metropolitanus]
MPRMPAQAYSKRAVLNKFTDAESENLLAFVKVNRSLWDTKSKEYIDTKSKVDIWNAIAQLIGESKTGDDCKNQYNNLRSTFQKKWKIVKTKPSGSEADKAKKWHFWDQMQFLGDVFTMAETSDSAGIEPCPQDVPDIEGDQRIAEEEEEDAGLMLESADATVPCDPGDISESPNTPSTSSSGSATKTAYHCTPGKKRKREGYDQLIKQLSESQRRDDELAAETSNVLKSFFAEQGTHGKKFLTTEELFCDFVLSTLNSTTAEQKERIKKGIQNVIARELLNNESSIERTEIE